jgi:hypothetical protein
MPGNIILGTNGSRSITPPDNATTVYTLTTSNTAGTSSCTAQVTTAVIALPPVPPPTCSIASNPSSVTNGSTTQLSWSISNATGGILNPGNISVTSLSTRIVTPPSDTTTVYTLSATNSG